jgi:hypothetical protein
MKWTDIPLKPTPKMLRQFAAAALVFFLVIGARQYFVCGQHKIGVALGVLAVVIGVPGLIKPAAVRWLFVGWMVLAFPIGWLVSQIVLLLMYYLMFTPVAVLFRLRGRDPLCRRPAPGRSSYWTPKQTPQDVRSYFRQY